MGQKKGQTGNPDGRPKGVPNKTTKEARELFISIMNGEIDNIQDALRKVRDDSPTKYLDALSKLFQYTMPKQVDVSSGGEPITDIKVTYVDKLEGDNGK
jgi:hypothetical protein